MMIRNSIWFWCAFLVLQISVEAQQVPDTATPSTAATATADSNTPATGVILTQHSSETAAIKVSDNPPPRRHVSHTSESPFPSSAVYIPIGTNDERTKPRNHLPHGRLYGNAHQNTGFIPNPYANNVVNSGPPARFPEPQYPLNRMYQPRPNSFRGPNSPIHGDVPNPNDDWFMNPMRPNRVPLPPLAPPQFPRRPLPPPHWTANGPSRPRGFKPDTSSFDFDDVDDNKDPFDDPFFSSSSIPRNSFPSSDPVYSSHRSSSRTSSSFRTSGFGGPNNDNDHNDDDFDNAVRKFDFFE